MNDRTAERKEEAGQGEVRRDAGATHDEPIVETREEARQGETTAPMQRVLVAGIALVIIGFILAYLFVFS